MTHKSERPPGGGERCGNLLSKSGDGQPQCSAETAAPQEHAVDSWRSWLAVHPAADLFPMMTDAELQKLADDIKQNDLREKIKVWRDKPNNKLYLVDGRNRADALELNGESLSDGTEWNDDYIEEVFDPKYDPFDPLAYIISANIRRRHLTQEQTREVTAKLLKSKPDQSNRQVAKTVGVSHHTVEKVRADLESTGQIAQLDKTTGADGKARPKKSRKQKIEHQEPTAASTPEQTAEPLYVPPAPPIELMPATATTTAPTLKDLNDFEHAAGAILTVLNGAAKMKVPQIHRQRATELLDEIDEALVAFRDFRDRIAGLAVGGIVDGGSA